MEIFVSLLKPTKKKLELERPRTWNEFLNIPRPEIVRFEVPVNLKAAFIKAPGAYAEGTKKRSVL